MAAAALYLAFAILSTAYSINEQRKARNRARDAADAAKGYELSIEGSASPIPIVMGRNMTGGVRVFHQTSHSYRHIADPGVDCAYLVGMQPGRVTYGSYYDSNNERMVRTETVGSDREALTDNEDHEAPDFLYVDHIIGAGPIATPFFAKVDQLPFNHKDFQSGIRVWLSPTGAAVVANPMTSALGWTTRQNAKFPGVAAAGVVYRLNRDDPQFSGNVPDAQFFSDGWLCYDVSASNTLITARTATTNPVRQLLTYLLDPTFGRGLPVTQIDLPSFRAGIVLCNRVVQASVACSGTVWESRGITARSLPLFESCLTLDTSKPYRDNIQEILDTMIGADLLWSEGKYKFKLQVPQSFAEIRFAGPPVTSDLILRDSVQIKYPDASSRKNIGTIKFRNEHKDFAEDSVTWPPRGSTLHNTYLAEDGNIPLEIELNISGITNPYHALARVEEFIRTSRISTAYTFKMFVEGASYEPGDIIQVEAPEVGIPAEVLKILAIQVDENNVAEIQATKFQWDTLAWNAKDDEYVPARVYESNILREVSNVTFTPTSSLVGFTSGRLEWTLNSVGLEPDEYIIRTASSNNLVAMQPSWQELGRASGDQLVFELPPLQSGSYLFSVTPMRRGNAGYTMVSAAFALAMPELEPKDLTPPPKPAAFTVTSSAGEVVVTLAAAPDYTQGHGHAFTEILYALAAQTSGTVKGTFIGATGATPATLGLGVSYKVWTRFVSKDGVPGPISDPVTHTVSQIVSAEIADAAISRTKFANDIQPVGIISGTVVPTTKTTDVVLVNGVLYRWNGSAYASSISVNDIPNAALTAAKFAADVQPVSIVSGTVVPTTKSTDVILVNGSIYRWSGSAYTKAVPSTDISGKLTDSQVNLTIGGANVVTNSSFEADSSWVLPSGATYLTSSLAQYGGCVLQIVNASATDNPVTQTIALKPSTKYTISGWRRLVSATAAPFSSRTVGVTTTEVSAIATSGVIVTGAWTRFSVVITTAATVTNAKVVLYGAVGATLWDGIQVEEGETLTSFAPRPDEILPGAVGSAEIAAGAVTTSKLVANAVTADKIAANAVTAGKIEAGAVTADKILANAVTAGKIAAGAVSADAIAANAVTAKHIHVGDLTNLVWNGGGKLDADASEAAGWSGTGGFHPISSRATWLANYNIAADSVITFRARDNTFGDNISVSPGERFWGRMDGVVSNGVSPQTTIRLALVFKAKLTDTVVGSPSIVQFNAGGPAGAYSGEGVVEVPAGAAYAVPFVIIETNDGTAPYGIAEAGKSWHLTNIEIRRQNSARLIVDGAITTDKLSANAVTAGKIAAGAVRAEQIAADAISVKHLAVTDFANLCTNKGYSNADWVSSIGQPDVADHLGYMSNAGIPGRTAIAVRTRDTEYENTFPVSPGEQYGFTWSTFPGGGGTGTQPIRIGLHLKGVTGTETWIPAIERAANIAGPLTQTGFVEIPPGYDSATVWMQLPNNGGVSWTDPSMHYWATNIEVRRRNSGHLIVDGAITANKLNVGQLSAITANIGLLRTAASGARVEIENNQIRGYDGSNLLRFRLGVF